MNKECFISLIEGYIVIRITVDTESKVFGICQFLAYIYIYIYIYVCVCVCVCIITVLVVTI